MNALFGALEESGEGDLRSTMSFELGLKSSWSSLDGRVSGVNALPPAPLSKNSTRHSAQSGVFLSKDPLRSKIKGVELLCCTSSSAFRVVVLVLETAYQVLPFLLSFPVGMGAGPSRKSRFFSRSISQK